MKFIVLVMLTVLASCNEVGILTTEQGELTLSNLGNNGGGQQFVCEIGARSEEACLPETLPDGVLSFIAGQETVCNSERSGFDKVGECEITRVLDCSDDYLLADNTCYRRTRAPFISERNLPQLFSAFNLFLAPGILNTEHYKEFTPSTELYSDGEFKQRWIHLPAGAQIDNEDMKNWNFPIGTIVIKRFADPNDTLTHEMRVMVKVSDLTKEQANSSLTLFEQNWAFAAYEYDNFLQEAFLLDGSAPKLVNNASHEIPSRAQCIACHRGANDAPLGFAGLLLSKPSQSPSEYNIDSLVVDNRFTHAATQTVDFDHVQDQDRPIYEYLYVNCQHCHNPDGFPGSFLTTLNLKEPDPEILADNNLLVRGSDPSDSRIFVRMTAPAGALMPALGVTQPDTEFIEALRSWLSTGP